MFSTFSLNQQLNYWHFKSFRIHPIAPYDFFFFFLFPKLYEHIKGTKCDSDEKIKSVVKWWITAQDKQFYIDSIVKLVERWNVWFLAFIAAAER